MLRYLDSEFSPKKGKRSRFRSSNNEGEEEEEKGITPGYKMRRDLMGEGERLDTIEGDDEDNYDNYGDEEPSNQKNKNQIEKIEMTLDDV